MSEQNIHYELDMSGPDEPGSPTRDRSLRISRQGLVIATAFLVGMVIGAAGLSKHHDATASRVRSNEVSLVAVLGSPRDPEQLVYEIRILNNGPLPIQIGNATLIAPGYEDAVSSQPATEGRAVEPGQWTTLTSLRGSPVCPAGSVDTREADVSLMVTTESGISRQIEVPLLDQHDELATMRHAECEAILHPERLVNAYADAPAVDADGTHMVSLLIENYGRRPVDVGAIQPREGLDIDVLDQLPITLQPGSAISVDVQIAGLDCDVAFQGPHLAVTAQAGGSSIDHEVWLDPYILQVSELDCAGQG